MLQRKLDLNLDHDRIEKLIRDHPRLSWIQKSVAWLLLSYRKTDGKVYVEKRQWFLCQKTGLSRYQLTRILKSLRDQRVIVSVPVDDSPTRYHNRYYFVEDLEEATEMTLLRSEIYPEELPILDDFRCAGWKLENPETAHWKRSRKALMKAVLQKALKPQPLIGA